MSVNPGVTGTFPLDESLPVDPSQPYDKQTNPAEFWGAYAMERTNQVVGSWYEVYPGYGGWKSGQVAFAKAYLGVKWTEFRKMFVELFDGVFKQASTRRYIKEVMMRRAGKYIPVRTGHLYDAIFRSLYFNNKHWGNTRHLMTMWFRWPLDRPMPIKGQTGHAPPANGHGDPWGVIGMPIKYQAPNIQFLGVGPRGGLIYGLNDPLAQPDPTPFIIEEGIKQMQDMFRNVYQGLRVKMVHRATAGAVTVSGGGQSWNISPKTP